MEIEHRDRWRHERCNRFDSMFARLGRTYGLALALLALLGVGVWSGTTAVWFAISAVAIVIVAWACHAVERDRSRASVAQEHFAQLFDTTPIPAMVVRVRDFHYAAVNPAFTTCFGYRAEQLIGRTSDGVKLLKDPSVRQRVTAKLASDGALHGMETVMRASDGTEHVVAMSIVPMMFHGDGHMVVTLVDRTVQLAAERAERAERESEDRFGKAFSASPVASIMVRASDNAIVAVNDAGLKLFAYSREQLVGSSADAFQFHVDLDARDEMYAELVRVGRVRDRELRLATSSGSILDVIAAAVTLDLDGVPHVLYVVQDVTKQKRIEAALRDSEARFRDVTETIREVFWLTNPHKNEILYISPGYEAMWGRSCAQLLANPRDWSDAIHPDDRDRVIEAAISRQVSGGYDEQYRIVRPDGTIRHIRDRAFPVREGDVVTRIAGLAEDITDQRALEDQLRQAQKLESLGLLAGGIAHDFNNMLAVIAASAGLLDEAMAADHPDRELVIEIDHAVQRATSLTRQLLAFSRKQVTEPVVLDLNACVNDTRKMLRRMVGEDIVLTTSLEPELQHVKVDPGYLVQVIMNLVVNARDAMPRGGMLDLTTRNVVIDETHVRAHPTTHPGPGVMLAVRDTGCGMPHETLERVFEPFFTTKPVGRGTGMGLAVVRGIIDQAGGFLEVESTVGVGTAFRIYLPATDAALAQDHPHTGATALGVETLLVVDDDDHVRRSAARALRSRGYTVLEAGGGEAALRLLAHDANVSLMVTDVVMPGMDGRELAEQTHLRFPHVKVLYTSGYTDDAVVRHGVMQGEVELIEKPFRIETLATKVRQMLDVA